MESVNHREFAREKLPAIAEEFTSGPWTEGANRFLDWLITQAEGQNDASKQNR
jgi:hypothetical protein